jgi:3-dehydroquinate dehydratase-2|tara:strand:- start:1473 stop:1904 length:432 start_codon:yes stop_codon:yes gene_type:complete
MSVKSISIIHGPNLNLLGEREPDHYGTFSLAEINKRLINEAKALSITIDIFQSNSESELIEKIQVNTSDFIIINPAAFTHSSIAMRDALSAKKIRFIEVHISNVFARESFRKESYFSDIAVGIISGLGAEGYIAALTYAAKLD